ncbi:transcriptional regulator GutM [Ligilactobacillus salivarius]|uniref:transcriptional regulator GutM n=1 Tax=Ligilactobacillus salivarius TaxID=1624 RepID=UPI0030F6330F
MKAGIPLIIFLIFIVLLKYYFSILNNKMYVREYNSLLEKFSSGFLGVGIYQSNFRVGQICLLIIDNNEKIIECKRIKGITVFAKFREVNDIIGMNAREVLVNNKSQAIKLAIENALKEKNKVGV